MSRELSFLYEKFVRVLKHSFSGTLIFIISSFKLTEKKRFFPFSKFLNAVEKFIKNVQSAKFLSTTNFSSHMFYHDFLSWFPLFYIKGTSIVTVTRVGRNIYLYEHKYLSKLLYSVRGLERSELGRFHGCPGRLWDRFYDRSILRLKHRAYFRSG